MISMIGIVGKAHLDAHKDDSRRNSLYNGINIIKIH